MVAVTVKGLIFNGTLMKIKHQHCLPARVQSLQWSLPSCGAVRVGTSGYIWTAIVRMLLCVSVCDWADMMWDSAADCGLLQKRFCHVQPLKSKLSETSLSKKKKTGSFCVCFGFTFRELEGKMSEKCA